MTKSGLTSTAIVGILIISGMAIMSPARNVSAHEYLYGQYILHPDRTVSNTGWTTWPNDGVLWNKLTSNDANTTTINSTAAGQICKIGFGSFSGPPGLDQGIEDGIYELSVRMWIVCRASTSGSGVQFKMLIFTYGYVSMYTGLLATGTYWVNSTVKDDTCPFNIPTEVWTSYDVNNTVVELTSLVVGKTVVTELGLIINVTTEPDRQIILSFGTLGLFGILIFLAAVTVVKVVKW